MNHLVVSVIIPTYNRQQSLFRTLSSLAAQSCPPETIEVIVVDDGSTDGSSTVAQNRFPYSLTCLKQKHQGATSARNHGATHSRGNILVFLDDDITISPETVQVLTDRCRHSSRVIVLGTLVAPAHAMSNSIFAQVHLSPVKTIVDETPVPFPQCKTGLLAIKRKDFFELDMFHDPTGGWPNWDDVDFGYRAHLRGYHLIQCPRAIGNHWDYSVASIEAACGRWRRASISAVRLFRLHPGLQPHIPMFHDKAPIGLGRDPARLIARKLARRVASSRFAVANMEQLAHALERHLPSPFLLRHLYRWIVGAYIFRGYRAGLRQYGPVPEFGSAHLDE